MENDSYIGRFCGQQVSKNTPQIRQKNADLRISRDTSCCEKKSFSFIKLLHREICVKLRSSAVSNFRKTHRRSGRRTQIYEFHAIRVEKKFFPLHTIIPPRNLREISIICGQRYLKNIPQIRQKNADLRISRETSCCEKNSFPCIRLLHRLRSRSYPANAFFSLAGTPIAQNV